MYSPKTGLIAATKVYLKINNAEWVPCYRTTISGSSEIGELHETINF